jgi:hypothetical protein
LYKKPDAGKAESKNVKSLIARNKNKGGASFKYHQSIIDHQSINQ